MLYIYIILIFIVANIKILVIMLISQLIEGSKEKLKKTSPCCLYQLTYIHNYICPIYDKAPLPQPGSRR